MNLKGYFVLVVSGVFWASSLSQAAPVHWTGGSVSNDWNDVANWDVDYLPGATEADTVLLVDSGDSTTLVTPFTFTKRSSIKLRGEPTMTLSADLSGVNGLFLGGNANLTGGFVHQTDGTLSVVTLRVGSLETASSESIYTLSGGCILNSGNLYVNRGKFLLQNNTGTVSTTSLSITDIGTLAFALGSNGTQAIEAEARFDIAENAKLIIDASGLDAGEGIYELVKFGMLLRKFNPENVTIIGLETGLNGSITYDANSMKLTIDRAPGALGLITF